MRRKRIQQNQIVEEVKEAPLDKKKEIVEEALKEAAAHGNANELLRHIVHAASSNGKRAIATEAVAADEEAAGSILSEAVKHASVDATKTAVAKAVRNADGEDAQELVTEALNAASSDTARAAVEDAKFSLSPGTLDQIWLLIVKTFAYVLVGATVALVSVVVLDIFYDVELAHVQIILTMFTTVAGILAGFITGQAVGTAKERGKDRG